MIMKLTPEQFIKIVKLYYLEHENRTVTPKWTIKYVSKGRPTAEIEITYTIKINNENIICQDSLLPKELVAILQEVIDKEKIGYIVESITYDISETSWHTEELMGINALTEKVKVKQKTI